MSNSFFCISHLQHQLHIQLMSPPEEFGRFNQQLSPHCSSNTSVPDTRPTIRLTVPCYLASDLEPSFDLDLSYYPITFDTSPYSANMPLKFADSRGHAWERADRYAWEGRTDSSDRGAGKKESSKGISDRQLGLMKWVAGKNHPTKGNDQRDRSWNIADFEEGLRISAELCNAN